MNIEVVASCDLVFRVINILPLLQTHRYLTEKLDKIWYHWAYESNTGRNNIFRLLTRHIQHKPTAQSVPPAPWSSPIPLLLSPTTTPRHIISLVFPAQHPATATFRHFAPTPRPPAQSSPRLSFQLLSPLFRGETINAPSSNMHDVYMQNERRASESGMNGRGKRIECATVGSASSRGRPDRTGLERSKEGYAGMKVERGRVYGGFVRHGLGVWSVVALWDGRRASERFWTVTSGPWPP